MHSTDLLRNFIGKSKFFRFIADTLTANASCMVIKIFDAKYCKVFKNSMMMRMTVKTILEAARM